MYDGKTYDQLSTTEKGFVRTKLRQQGGKYLSLEK